MKQPCPYNKPNIKINKMSHCYFKKEIHKKSVNPSETHAIYMFISWFANHLKVCPDDYFKS